MRRKQPYIVRMGEVRLIRKADEVEIHYPEPEFHVIHLRLGPKLAEMTDEAIIERWNDTLRAQAERAAQYKHVVVEVPLGSPQIEYHADSEQWVARGSLLRCHMLDDAEGRPVVEVDDQELSWEEFGRLVLVRAGWAMRIAFVPNDEVHRQPRVEVREPED